MAAIFYLYNGRADAVPLLLALPTAGGSADVVRDPSAGIFTSFGAWPMECGGSFVVGDPIATDSGGRAVQAQSGDVVLGHAIEASTGYGDTAVVGLHMAGYRL